MNTLRVVQWGTGTLGKIGIRHFAQNSAYKIVGAAVFSDQKAGIDIGEIAEIAPLGVAATTDHDALLALDADCVFYAPLEPRADEICRILRSGKNVVSTTGYFFPSASSQSDFERIDEACRDGGTSYFGSGIHPGFAGDVLPLTLCRLQSRIDKVQVYEVVNFSHSGPGAAKYLEQMAFGISPEEFAARPNTLSGSLVFFEQSMTMLAEGLGQRVDDVTSSVEVGIAQRDMDFHGFPVPKGSVAAQHHEWTAWSGGRPLVVFHAVYTLGYEDIEPLWNLGDIHYRICVEGDPGAVIDLSGSTTPGGVGRPYGYVWTAMAALNAIPQVCEAAPGIVTNLDLGVVQPLGLVGPGVA